MVTVKCINMYANENVIIQLIRNFYGDVQFTETNPDILICGVFGKRCYIEQYINTNVVKCTIFFTGENTERNHLHFKEYDDYMLDTVNISLGFKRISHKNYIRFPLYYSFANNINIDGIANNIIIDRDIHGSILNLNKNNPTTESNKKNFMCMVSRHDPNKIRYELFYLFRLHKNVNSGGRYLNTLGKRIGGHHSGTEMFDFYKDHKFNKMTIINMVLK